MKARVVLAAAALLIPVDAALGQQASSLLGPSLTGSALSIALALTLLSLLPGILLTMTAFVRILVVLSLLRTGLGAPGAPPNIVIISLALFLSFFVMRSTMEAAWDAGVQPYVAGTIKEAEAFEKTTAPFRTFMLAHTREADLKLFVELSRTPPQTREKLSLSVLVPAFMISELKRAFEIGFLLLVPFVVIDLVVAAVLMGLGLMMLPPATISLPAKLIFFVLVDGWALVAGSLVRSFAGSG